MRVRSNAGEQYLSGTDDFVESEIQLSGAIFGESSVFIETLNQEMEAMDGVSKSLWGRINSYHKDLKVDGKEIANKGTGDYWQLCERLFQELVDTCSTAPDQAKEYRNKYLQFAFIVYDKYCPNQSARQMEAWAANRFGFDQSFRENKKEAKIK
jgi:CRISPR system Cascade subunit CasA